MCNVDMYVICDRHLKGDAHTSTRVHVHRRQQSQRHAGSEGGGGVTMTGGRAHQEREHTHPPHTHHHPPLCHTQKEKEVNILTQQDGDVEQHLLLVGSFLVNGFLLLEERRPP